MGYDLYGSEPSTKEGEYFRRNIWYWGPLADLCLSVAPKECRPCKQWHTNDGDGLDADEAIELAEALERGLKDGRVTAYIAALRARPDCDRRGGSADVPREGFQAFVSTLKEAANFRDDVTEDDVREFVAFLKGCGGFSIC